MRFLLVDRIEELEPGRRGRGYKNAAMSEDYFEWHFPGRPIVPGVLILESLVQMAGWLEAEASDFARWFLLERVASARYYAFAGPGDRLDLEVEVVAEGEAIEAGDDVERRSFRGTCRVDGKRGAVVEFSGRLVPLERLEGAERARRTLAALRGEMPPAAGGRR